MKTNLMNKTELRGMSDSEVSMQHSNVLRLRKQVADYDRVLYRDLGELAAQIADEKNRRYAVVMNLSF